MALSPLLSRQYAGAVTDAPDSARAVILSPTEYERRTLAREAALQDCVIVRCGVGADRVRVAVEQHCAAGDIAILCGIAGGLAPAFRAGSALLVTEVVNAESGFRWTPPIGSQQSPQLNRTVRITASGHVLCSTKEKAGLQNMTGADLVDLESVAFAQAADYMQLQWGIVRGVSDALETDLPPDLGRWVHPDGRIRVSAIVRSLIRRRASIRQINQLRRASSAALRDAAAIVSEAI